MWFISNSLINIEWGSFGYPVLYYIEFTTDVQRELLPMIKPLNCIKHQSFSITSMLNIYMYCYVTIVEAGLHEFNDEIKWMFIVTKILTIQYSDVPQMVKITLALLRSSGVCLIEFQYPNYIYFPYFQQFPLCSLRSQGEAKSECSDCSRPIQPLCGGGSSVIKT